MFASLGNRLPGTSQPSPQAGSGLGFDQWCGRIRSSQTTAEILVLVGAYMHSLGSRASLVAPRLTEREIADADDVFALAMDVTREELRREGNGPGDRLIREVALVACAAAVRLRAIRSAPEAP